MTSKNETGAFIKYFGNSKSQLTEPETVVRGILKELGYGYRLQEMITVGVKDKDSSSERRRLLTKSCMSSSSSYPGSNVDEFGQSSTFTIDLFIPEHKICVEVDGIHHMTGRQERKTAWRDAQLIANGYKVLHIDAEWTETEPRKAALREFMKDGLNTLRFVSDAKLRRISA